MVFEFDRVNIGAFPAGVYPVKSRHFGMLETHNPSGFEAAIQGEIWNLTAPTV